MTYCLQDERVSLHPAYDGDAMFLRELRNEAEQIAGSYQVWPISVDEQDAWWAKTKDDPTQKRFVIRQIPIGLEVGAIALTHIDLQDGGAELGIRVAKDCWRKGYASAAIRLLSNWAFDQARMRRLYSEVFACNAASIALFEKLGWHKWGVKTQAHWQGGQWHDVICYELMWDRSIALNGEVPMIVRIANAVEYTVNRRAKAEEDCHYAGVHCYSEPMKAGGK